MKYLERPNINTTNFSLLKEVRNNNSILESNKFIYDILDENESIFSISNNFYQNINESDNGETFVPRFSMKKFTNPIFAKFPPNKELKYDRDLMVLAMSYGMILQIQYRGADDGFVLGRSRICLPMCLGTSSKAKNLLRVYHLKGFSFSQNKNTDKVWRLFRTDRIMSMSFTGNFFRLTPEGYNSEDRGMRGGITKSVDIEEVRKNQEALASEGAIQTKKSVTLDKTKGKVSVVETIDSKSVLDLTKHLSNPNIEKDKDNLKLMRLTFLKSTTSNKGIVIMGAYGQKGNIIKISCSGKYLGEYRVMKATMGDALGKPHLRAIENIKDFDLQIFVKKRD